MMWWCGSGIAAAAIIAQWLRAQADHRRGGLHLFPQPSIIHIHISKDRYKHTRPDTPLLTSTLCLIYACNQPGLPKIQRFHSSTCYCKWPVCILVCFVLSLIIVNVSPKNQGIVKTDSTLNSFHVSSNSVSYKHFYCLTTTRTRWEAVVGKYCCGKTLL